MRVLAPLSFLAVGAVWEAAAHFHLYNAVLLPPPSIVLVAAWQMLRDGTMAGDAYASMSRYAIGLCAGSLLGIILGLVTARQPLVERMVSPILHYLRAIPSVALIPISIAWFGVGDPQKVLIVTWACLFPVWLSTFSGVAQVERNYVWAARSLGAKGAAVYRYVLLPRSIPYIASGVRISIANGFFAIAATELAAATNGLGFRVFNSYEVFRMDVMMAAVLTIGAIALAIDALFVKSLTRVVPWTTNNT